MEPDNRVVGEELVAPSGKREMVTQVCRRVAEIHRNDARWTAETRVGSTHSPGVTHRRGRS
jgi:hypothetical protein